MDKEKELEKILADWADSNPINEGHEFRFEQRLNQAMKQKRSSKIQKIWWAAAVFIAIAITVWTVRPVGNVIAENEVELPKEVGKVAVYFSEQVKLMNVNVTVGNDEVINHFVKELTRLENEYNKLNELYKNQPNNSNLIDGMIENFEFRLKIMQQLKSYLEITQSKEGNENKIA
ncbi:MAG: hypothetical protein R2809_13270 [Flavobacteriales bacterium]